ncbi:MAG: Glutamate--cysteine ligase EgtA [Acidimicrobiales bacterium]|nr:Glutamate--cysteine ligase EgtA [Acidimicrobiales bacterium]
MPSPGLEISADAIYRHVAEDVFAPRPETDIGLELEWITSLPQDRARRITLTEAEELTALSAELPAGSSLSIEPGGQLELATTPFESAAEVCDAAATDLFVLDQRCRARDVELIALGVDPLKAPQRIVVHPRYQAMEAYFAQSSAAGRTMMCNTASIQLNIGFGGRQNLSRRWHTAHLLGPFLIATFANSPFELGRPSGWVSTRMRTWWSVDSSRTAPPIRFGRDPVEVWADYALDARVMMVRASDTRYVPLGESMTFRQWLEHGHDLGWPTVDDFAYHLTTLFPPVRPRGWFELRVLDALPTPFWHIAVAVTTALLADADLEDALHRATSPSAGLWIDSARSGLAHPALQRTAADCFELAIESLQRNHADSATVALASRYLDHFIRRGRCPADDRLDAWRRDGRLHPPPESPLPLEEMESAWV